MENVETLIGLLTTFKFDTVYNLMIIYTFIRIGREEVFAISVMQKSLSMRMKELVKNLVFYGIFSMY